METDKKYLLETQKFLAQCVELAPIDRSFKKDNDRISQTALLYEKFRTAIEYQEDHLIFKNAISRIVGRQYALSFAVKAESLFDDLMNELAWADYLNIDTLTDEEIFKIRSIIDRYLPFIDKVKSRKLSRRDAQKTIIGWMASEIDEVLYSRKRQELLINFASFCLRRNLIFEQGSNEIAQSELQLRLTILPLLYKSDFSYAEYWLVKELFPAFHNFSPEITSDFATNFDNIITQTDRYFKNPLQKNYLSFAKKYIVPFALIKELLETKKDLTPALDNPEKLKLWLMETYDDQVKTTQTKVWRGTGRALIFIIITKISLAFLIEMPFDQFLKGSISYFPLMVNIFLPPVLMLLAGLSIKKPAPKNREIVERGVTNMIDYQQIDSKPFIIGNRKKTSLEKFFNVLFIIFNLAIIFGAIYLLDKIGFNFISIILFFFFISAVSFFSFRIRNIALELTMKISRENTIISLIEFIFMPFILIGKTLSAVITKSNPFTITLDFLIEAPLKSIIKITNSWLRFIRQKKDDLDA